MKWPVMPLCLVVTAYGQGHFQSDVAGMLAAKPEAPPDFELFEIDMTQKQLDYEYEKASKAISVNDAEKVYIQRIQEELQNRRERRCEKLKEDTLPDEPTCN